MAKINVYRFSEEEFVDGERGTVSLEFNDVRHIARTDSVDSAIKLLGVSGMRALNVDKHPAVALAILRACSVFGLPAPSAVLRGVHGTFVAVRGQRELEAPTPAPAPYVAALEASDAL